MKYIFTIFVQILLFTSAASAWEISTEKEDDGRVFLIAEQAGDGGGILELVCANKQTWIEVTTPVAISAEEHVTFLFQVDDNPERLVAGYIERVDSRASVFIGLDSRDRPAASTKDLLAQMGKGKILYLGDPDAREAIDQWSLIGAAKAIKTITKGCR